MTRVLENVEVKLVPRMSAEGHPFTEIQHDWDEAGEHRTALSRVRWPIDDTPYARAAAIEAFKRRQRQ